MSDFLKAGRTTLFSQAIATRRIRQATETGTQIIISACQQCERTLFNAAPVERLRIRIL